MKNEVILYINSIMKDKMSRIDISVKNTNTVSKEVLLFNSKGVSSKMI